MLGSTWVVNPVKIFTRRELSLVLDDLARHASRSQGTRMNRAIFRLACCCGLRVSEIAALGCETYALFQVDRTCGSNQRVPRETGLVSFHCGRTRPHLKTSLPGNGNEKSTALGLMITSCAVCGQADTSNP